MRMHMDFYGKVNTTTIIANIPIDMKFARAFILLRLQCPGTTRSYIFHLKLFNITLQCTKLKDFLTSTSSNNNFNSLLLLNVCSFVIISSIGEEIIGL